MQLAKINESGPGWSRKMKMAIIYQLILGKLMLVAPDTVIQARKFYSSMLSTTLLPLHWGKPTIDSSSEIRTCTPLARERTMQYGVAENVHTTAACPSLKQNTSPPIVNVPDRKHHLEAYILSFVAENSSPLSVVPKLIEFSQFLFRDPKALSQIQINRTAASYKLKHGFSVFSLCS